MSVIYHAVLLRGTLDVTIVGHIPRELSSYIWFALQLGAEITGKVKSDRHRPSPLLQGGLEIPVTVTVEWKVANKLSILKENVASVGYSMVESYKDDSEYILKKILGDRDEQDEPPEDDILDGRVENVVESEEEDEKEEIDARKKMVAQIQISSDEEEN